MKPKIYFKTVGCRINQIETQSIREKVQMGGFEETDAIENADFIFLNSCCVTHKADRDVKSFLRKSLKKNASAKMVVTGCTATIYPEEIKKLCPSAIIFKNADKERIPDYFLRRETEKDFFSVSANKGKSRVFVKIQDGCNLKCSYCVVSRARNRMSSKRLKLVLSEISTLGKTYREIVLCGTRLGAYKCPESGANLATLTKTIFQIGANFRIRFSSIEPHEINEDLIEVLSGGKNRFCPHFHIPFQSGSDEILGKMRREQSVAKYEKIIKMIKKRFPVVSIFSDIIVGYPGETEKNFRETVDFVQRNELAGLHVFSYSPRPQSPAYGLKCLLPAVVRRRSGVLRRMDLDLRRNYARKIIGEKREILMLSVKNDYWLGLSEDFQKIKIANGEFKSGALVKVKITGFEDILVGKPLAYACF